MLSNKFNLKNCELSVNKKELEELAAKYPRNWGKFTYHLKPSQGDLVEKYRIKNYWIDYKSSDRIDPLFENICIYLSGPDDLPKIVKFIKTGAFEKIRIVARNQAVAPAIQTAADESGRPGSVCLSFGASGTVGYLESMNAFGQKYPIISRKPHFEFSTPGSAVENSILVALSAARFGRRGFSFLPKLNERRGAVASYNFSLELLRSIGYENIPGAALIACPTCSRARIDVISLARSVYEKIKFIEDRLTVAVMGCEVNGPGEAAHADVGVAGGLGSALLIEKGRVPKRIPPRGIEARLIERIDEIVKKR